MPCSTSSSSSSCSQLSPSPLRPRTISQRPGLRLRVLEKPRPERLNPASLPFKPPLPLLAARSGHGRAGDRGAGNPFSPAAAALADSLAGASSVGSLAGGVEPPDSSFPPCPAACHLRPARPLLPPNWRRGCRGKALQPRRPLLSRAGLLPRRSASPLASSFRQERTKKPVLNSELLLSQPELRRQLDFASVLSFTSEGSQEEEEEGKGALRKVRVSNKIK